MFPGRERVGIGSDANETIAEDRDDVPV